MPLGLPRAPLVVLVLALVAGCARHAPVAGPAQAATGPESTKATAADLHVAARAGDLDAVRRWVDAGVAVDAGDRYDASALMMAAGRGHAAVVRYLLDAGADVNHRERFFGTSAFDLAVQGRHAEIAHLLLAAGSDQREDAIEIALQFGVPGLAEAALAAGPVNASTLEQLRQRVDLSDSMREALAAARSRPDPAPPSYSVEELARFEGSFETFDPIPGGDVRARVTAVDGGLRLEIDENEAVDVTAFAERRFRTADGEMEAQFWGRLGTIESLILRRRNARPVSMRHSIAEPLGAAAYAYTAPARFETSSSNWSQFRGDRAAGWSEGRVFPDDWNLESGSGIRWQVELPGLGNSSPIVWGELVIVTTAVADKVEQTVRTGLTGAGDSVDEDVEHVWRVMAFDKRSGTPRWDVEVGRGVPLTSRHFKASQASPTPVTDGRNVVAVFPTAGIVCLDLDGRLLWKHELGGLNASAPGDPGMEWGFASSPVIHDGTVMLQVDTFDDPYVAAWDLETGEQLWRTARSGPPSWATPTLVEGRDRNELVLNGSTIRGYDPASGEELWSLGPNSEVVIATPVTGDGVVYVSAGYAPVKPIYAVRLGARGALEPEPGTSHPQLVWSHGRGGAYMPTPLLYRGMLYVVHHNGRMVAYDAGSGAPVYKTRFSRGGTFTASPVAGSGRLYVSTEEGLVYVVEAGPEYREIAVNELPEPLMATPALSDGVVYLRTTRRLVAVGG